MALGVSEPEKAQIARRFNRHAGTYDRYARAQQRLADELLERVPGLVGPGAAILELGCGTGYVTERLADRFPAARIVGIDLAERMVAATARRIGRRATIELIVGDAEQHPWPEGAFDAIVSSSTIQWFTHPQTTMARLARSLRPGGHMLHTAFGPGTFRELFALVEQVEAERRLESRTGRVFALRSAEDWARELEHAGMRDVTAGHALVEYRYASCRELLAEIARTGASYNPAGRGRFDVLAEVARRYDREWRSAGGVVATYDLVHVEGRVSG